MNTDAITQHSKFWLGKDFSFNKIVGSDGTIDIIRLSAYRRAISNFAFILTGKNIPVRFAENNKSFTDGRAIYIGSSLSKGEFDTTVGLALHESMHIVKSDFDLIKTLWGKIPRSLREAAQGKLSSTELAKLAKFILNVVEDRYIDAWADDTAPGYGGYYKAFYDKYFLNTVIGEALRSDKYRDRTVYNYKFRFTNSINEASDPDALPGLRKMIEMLDVKNILRVELSSPHERAELAFAITEEIVNNLGAEDDSGEEENPSDMNGDGDSDESEPGDESPEETPEENDSSADESGGEKTNGSDEEGDDKEEPTADGDEASDSPPEENTGDDSESSGESSTGQESSETVPEQTKEVEELLQEQEDFINREIRQTAFDAETLKKLNALEKHGVDIVSVGAEEGVPEVDCIVVSDMTEELIRAGDFPYTPPISVDVNNPQAEQGVQEGILLGKMLGRRLQIRDEVKTTKFNRLARGKIDRRVLSSIGHGSENVFFQTTSDKYKKVHLHISVDASGSMSTKWKKTMTTLVALAKAASMINNVSVCISFRSGIGVGKGLVTESPYIIIAYDSRVDKFEKIPRLFPKLYPAGSTPEGLAFQAILHRIPAGTHELDSYFVNLSDGEPYFGGGMYTGTAATNHTKKQVDKIRALGVSVMSYFIEGGIDSLGIFAADPKDDFRKMYGKDAQFIDVEDVSQIAYTLNRKFLEKEG